MGEDFRLWLMSLGLRPRTITAGRWVRCPTEHRPRGTNGAFFLAPTGEVGWAMDWATDTEPRMWRREAEGRQDEPGAAARLEDALRATLAANRAAIEAARAELRESQRRASREAHAWYWGAEPLRGGHPYLEAHGLTVAGCRRAPHGRHGPTHGLRTDARGRLVVPVQRLHLWRGKPWTQSVQLIEPGGLKRYWPGAPVKGGSYLIDARPGSGAGRLLLCEGLATGLALYGMVDYSAVRVCFSAGGLVEVAGLEAAELRRIGSGANNGASGGDDERSVPYLHLPHTVCGDNDPTICKPHRDLGLLQTYDPWERRPDWCKCNPGRAAAVAAAIALGCHAAIPPEAPGCTDWSDWVAAKEAAYLPTGKYDRLRRYMAGARAELGGLLAGRRAST